MKSPKDMVQALLDLGLTQTKIASESGVTQPTISRALAGNGVSYENGKKIEAYYLLKTSTLSPAEAEAKRNGGIRSHGDARDIKNISK